MSAHTRKGFTLIEMVIVVAILGVLATTSISYYQDYLQQTREAVVRENLRTVRASIANYFKMNLEYPTKFDQLRMNSSIDSLLLYPLQDPNAQLMVNIPARPPLVLLAVAALASNPFQVPLASMTLVPMVPGSTQYLGTDGEAQQFNDIKVKTLSVTY